MSKKRPSTTAPGASRRQSRSDSKWEPAYWRRRLFKNSYTHNRRRFRTRNWCVKIQHLGQRKTLSLLSSGSARAAREACAAYRNIVTKGWDATSRSGSPSLVEKGHLGLADIDENRDPSEASYWRERLIHRQYSSQPRTEVSQELFVRIQHDETSHYFPLGTDDRGEAAERASRIYRAIIDQGWSSACQRFARELTLAFHWQDNPLAWTYTAVHTRTAFSPIRGASAPAPRAGLLNVLIAESDSGLRLALQDCLDGMDGLYRASTVTSAGEALRQVLVQKPHLLLAGQHVAERPSRVWLERLRAVAPGVTGLIYSVHEDSPELFRATPGGASAYLLRRTPPTHFLDPLRSVLGQPGLSPHDIAAGVWQYFKNTVASAANRGLPDELTSLTHREHEVLALLSKGYPHKFIADRLRISTYTVHGHVRNIFEKLRVHNRVEAVVKYFQK